MLNKIIQILRKQKGFWVMKIKKEKNLKKEKIMNRFLNRHQMISSFY